MKKLIIFLLIFFATMAVMVLSEYYFLVKNAERQINDDFLNTKAHIVSLAEQSFQNKNQTSFVDSIHALQKKSRLKGVELSFKKHLFKNSFLLTLLPHTDETWDITDITVDAYYGIIAANASGIYELTLNLQVANTTEYTIPITFYVSKGSIIKDTIFLYQPNSNIPFTDKDLALSFHEEKIDTNEFTLRFFYNLSLDSQQLSKNLTYFTLQSAVYLLLIFLFCFIFYRWLLKKKIFGTIHILDQYVSNILEGKMVKDSSLPVIVNHEFSHLHNNIIELTRKFVNLSNELSVSKDIILQKERSDELTGLPNKKSFETDLKYMFIANKTGYVMLLRIDKIGLFTKNHGPEIVDSLIEDFSKIIQDFFRNQTQFNGTIYRFFGGEFAIIVYESDPKHIETMLRAIYDLTKTLSDKYYFFDNSIFYGATPFDRYGSIESIVQSAHDAYDSATKDKSTFYFIADAAHQLELNHKLENTVKDIIERNDFVLQYMHDTYSYGENPTLLMQEISPLIIDSFTFESIPSGKFISVAEKLGFITQFDQAVIDKTLEQIQMGELEHHIGIVLSVTSLSNQLFLSWLEDKFINYPAIRQIIFVAPSYSVASNYETFHRFALMLQKHNQAFMIKRFDPIDLALEKLLPLNLNSIRLERTLCQDFKKDSTKQHAVKQILLFCDDHNIKLLSDSVKNEQDYLAFEMLGFYGTTK